MVARGRDPVRAQPRVPICVLTWPPSEATVSEVKQARTFEGNAEAIEAWNGVLYDKFVRFRDELIGSLGVCGTAALERHAPAPGSRVLDVGCGFGDSTQELARLVGDAGEAVGVDAAERFIETARREAAAAGVGNARFLVADVQSEPLGGPYDHAFSRFGTMFFLSPVAALRNVRRSLKPGSPLCMVVWRKKEENAWVYEAERAVLDLVPLPESTDEATCGPGPFSMASPDLVSAQLLAAGYQRIGFERFDTLVRIGADIEHALEFAMALGPAGEIMRLAGDEARRREPEVIAALRRVLEPFVTPEGVLAPASVWIVSARAA